MDAPADVLGVDPRTVRGWEQRGHRPGPRLHARLAEVLDLPTRKPERPPGRPAPRSLDARRSPSLASHLDVHCQLVVRNFQRAR